jgi:hypothetical protein
MITHSGRAMCLLQCDVIWKVAVCLVSWPALAPGTELPLHGEYKIVWVSEPDSELWQTETSATLQEIEPQFSSFSARTLIMTTTYCSLICYLFIYLFIYLFTQELGQRRQCSDYATG